VLTSSLCQCAAQLRQLRAKTAVKYESTHRGDCAANQQGVDVHGQVDLLTGSASQRFDEARALLVAQRACASHFDANAAGRLICQAIEFVVDGIEHNQAPLLDQIGEKVLDRSASVALLTDAFQYLAPLVNRVKRLEEPPLEVGIRGEQSGHVVEFAPDRRDIAFLPGQREKSARVAVGGFVLHS
jgi:hypothetical protein